MSNPYPWMKFYPSKVRNDHQLKSCSLEARGLWYEMLWIMHECIPYGHLTVNERPMTDVELAKLIGEDLRRCRRLIAELSDSYVFSKTELGVIFCRKMVADDLLRRNAEAAGRLGGNPNLIKKRDNPQDKATLKPRIKKKNKEEEDLHISDPNYKDMNTNIGDTNNYIGLPKKSIKKNSDFSNFTLLQEHIDLAQSLNIDAKLEFDKFKDYCDSNGKRYKNYNAAFRNWIRNSKNFSQTTKIKNGASNGFETRDTRTRAQRSRDALYESCRPGIEQLEREALEEFYGHATATIPPEVD